MRFERTGQKGQVMLLGIIALIILLLAVFVLFDVQNLIRGKVKAQTAVDAAALTGANWQRHTLNLVGELNLVKASTVLVSDEIFGIGENPGTFLKADSSAEAAAVSRRDRFGRLAEASDLLSQLQYRILFLCPLIGFGAAQTAAKNNGLNYNESFGYALKQQNAMLAGFSDRAALYDSFKQDDFCAAHLYGFQWHVPYLNMLTDILQESTNSVSRGIAVLPSGELIGSPSLYTDPQANPDFCEYLDSRLFYDAVQGDDWCYLKDFLRLDFSANGTKWWGDLKVRQTNTFPMESEYLPVRVRLTGASSGTYAAAENAGFAELLRKDGVDMPALGDSYDWTDPAFGGNLSSSSDDGKLNPLPAIDWACYKDEWMDYGSETRTEWKKYLRNGFRGEAAYSSGAVSRMDSRFQPVTLSSRIGGEATEENGEPPTFAEAAGTFRGEDAGRNLARARTAQRLMRKTPPGIANYALAKPFGMLTVDGEKKPPHYSRMVLPVFEESALIPVALEDPGENVLVDYQWYLFLLNYMPVLGTVNSLADMPQELRGEFSRYHAILCRADNPEWRQYGINWLDTPTAWDDSGNVLARREDSCDYWPGGDNGGVRHMPAVKY